MITPYDTSHGPIDLIAVRRYLTDGPYPPLTDTERRYTAWLLVTSGLSVKKTAARLGAAEKTVAVWHAEREVRR